MTDATASIASPTPAQPKANLALSLAEAAHETGLSKSALYAAVHDGRLPARKFGRRTLVLRADLEAFLRALPAAAQANPATGYVFPKRQHNGAGIGILSPPSVRLARATTHVTP